jgi:O-acetyl-ADP-ribose deacetylase (regulator of RNase III)
MKTIQGDLIRLAREGGFDLIVHGCNCFGTMGAGIAKGIKAAFPPSIRGGSGHGTGKQGQAWDMQFR